MPVGYEKRALSNDKDLKILVKYGGGGSRTRSGYSNHRGLH